MRKLIMWNMVTVDGYFEGASKWEVEWHQYGWGEELERFAADQLKDADTLLFGRITYEGMAAHWKSAEGEIAELMNGISKVVFSRTMDAAEWQNTKLVKSDAVEEVTAIKKKPGKNILIFGSADLSATLTEAGLIDEYRLGINPVVLGNGTPLFKPGSKKMRLELVDVKRMKTGCVVLSYQPGD